MKNNIIIGSRGSQLALWQANYTRRSLEEQGYEVSIKIIKTQGDKIQNVTFDKLEGKGFFTKEIEQALLDKEVDLAVHSYKDLPTAETPGLTIAGNSYRAAPEDRMIIHKDALDKNKEFGLKENAVVGTSSPRRCAQLWMLRPDLDIAPIRGNVPTRVAKVGKFVDAVVLAGAGLDRLELDLSLYHVETLSPKNFISAPAQGVLAYQTRIGEEWIVEKLHDPQVADTLELERSILQKLEGGCQHPIGIYAEKQKDIYHLWACYGMLPENHAGGINSHLKNIDINQVYLQGKDKTKLIDEALLQLKKKKSEAFSSQEI